MFTLFQFLVLHTVGAQPGRTQINAACLGKLSQVNTVSVAGLGSPQCVLPGWTQVKGACLGLSQVNTAGLG